MCARLTIHRTPRHIYAQVFDDKGERVLAAASTVQKELAKDLKAPATLKRLAVSAARSPSAPRPPVSRASRLIAQVFSITVA